MIENKQNWGVHTIVDDENVKNTYRGKQILKTVSSPYDTFLEVLYHLKQSGMNLEIDHNLIKAHRYINFIDEPRDIEIFNDKKIISNSIDPYILKEFNYNF